MDADLLPKVPETNGYRLKFKGDNAATKVKNNGPIIWPEGSAEDAEMHFGFNILYQALKHR